MLWHCHTPTACKERSQPANKLRGATKGSAEPWGTNRIRKGRPYHHSDQHFWIILIVSGPFAALSWAQALVQPDGSEHTPAKREASRLRLHSKTSNFTKKDLKQEEIQSYSTGDAFSCHGQLRIGGRLHKTCCLFHLILGFRLLLASTRNWSLWNHPTRAT